MQSFEPTGDHGAPSGPAQLAPRHAANHTAPAPPLRNLAYPLPVLPPAATRSSNLPYAHGATAQPLCPSNPIVPPNASPEAAPDAARDEPQEAALPRALPRTVAVLCADASTPLAGALASLRASDGVRAFDAVPGEGLVFTFWDARDAEALAAAAGPSMAIAAPGTDASGTLLLTQSLPSVPPLTDALQILSGFGDVAWSHAAAAPRDGPYEYPSSAPPRMCLLVEFYDTRAARAAAQQVSQMWGGTATCAVVDLVGMQAPAAAAPSSGEASTLSARPTIPAAAVAVGPGRRTPLVDAPSRSALRLAPPAADSAQAESGHAVDARSAAGHVPTCKNIHSGWQQPVDGTSFVTAHSQYATAAAAPQFPPFVSRPHAAAAQLTSRQVAQTPPYVALGGLPPSPDPAAINPLPHLGSLLMLSSLRTAADDATPQAVVPPAPPRDRATDFNLQEALSGGRARTTVMIRNIPCRWTQQKVLGVLRPFIQGQWDVFHMPLAPCGLHNAGYAFVNFVDSRYAAWLFVALQGKRWPGTRSAKVIDIRYAHMQGRGAMSLLCGGHSAGAGPLRGGRPPARPA